ncbi:MAG: hypothetical protein KKF30_04225 [Proteobacteria bacterium]|nr:hypothetical protein [Pseudomonadota bacterium]MBU4053765.1 hypothetical protein [Pseudomonadota bacterium]MBU4316462.1 hypothetical protein [Pseudomonadota bacterium]MBU4471931.1 hypothetical protein [Pseudomonadota bacterium]MCG2752793.1 hypothetical protein [Desulfobacteraceae bacterium]
MQKALNAVRTILRSNRVYFTKQTERKVLFIMTLAMLIWGALVKMGYL